MAQHNGEIGTRHASDYDDFYIASKEESEQQILTAEEFLILVEKYCLEQIEILEMERKRESCIVDL